MHIRFTQFEEQHEKKRHGIIQKTNVEKKEKEKEREREIENLLGNGGC